MDAVGDALEAKTNDGKKVARPVDSSTPSTHVRIMSSWIPSGGGNSSGEIVSVPSALGRLPTNWLSVRFDGAPNAEACITVPFIMRPPPGAIPKKTRPRLPPTNPTPARGISP